MRPLSIEFQAFGPYKDKEFVDFEELSRKGLFLICGETGSGKTMILDAITYALYGKSSGAQREDFASARCKHSQWGVDTYVDFKFEAGGRIYRFERRLECKRSNLSPKYNVYILGDNEIFEPMFENCKDSDMKDMAKELIGLDFEQFRQVILLPQGQFEKLLTASSEDKEAVLVNIFGVNKWKKIADNLYDVADEKLKNLKKLKEQLSDRLKSEQCESVEEFKSVINQMEQDLTKLNIDFEGQDYDNKKEKIENIKQFISQMNDAKAELEKRLNAEKEMKRKKEEALCEVEDKKKQYTALLEKKDEIENIKIYVAKLMDKKQYYEKFEELKNKTAKEEKNLRKCKQEIDELQRLLQEEKEKTVVLGEEVKKLNIEHGILMTAYIDGIVGGIAKDLKEGEPCPVCGSVSHPCVAKVTDENVSKAEVEKKKLQAEKKEKDFEMQKSQSERIEKQLLESEKEYQNQESIVKMSIQEMEYAKEQLPDDAATIEEFYDLVEKKRLQVEKYEKDVERVAKALENCNHKTADIEGRLISIIEEIKHSEEKYNTCKSYYNEHVKGLDSELTMEECNNELKSIAENIKNYTEQKTKYQVLLQDKKKKVETFEEMVSVYDSQIKEAESDWAFAKSLRGDTGIGLQRYVLGIMFSSVVSAANKMLEKVHGGRYRLYRTDEKTKGSNKKGLELFVYDSFAGIEEGRSVKTLSGGEKFLVSLALSIGLSTVAKRSGISLDAMFIDEGFGSLDENSIEDAMDILQGIQKSNGVVGIISHVQILKDNIPTKLEIVKNREGSKIL